VSDEPIRPSMLMPMVSVDQLQAHYAELMRIRDSMMKSQVHFGVIPKCGDKPTLLQPGAQLLAQIYGLTHEFAVDSRCEATGHYLYTVTCKMIRRDTREYVGCGQGSCSTQEKRFWGKAGPEVSNNALKMAQKRAYVCAVLYSLAASELYTQDLEDMAGGTQQPTATPQTRAPAQRQAPARQPATRQQPAQNAMSEAQQIVTVTMTVTDCTLAREGESKGRKWKLWNIVGTDTDGNTREVSTFKPEHAEAAQAGAQIRILCKSTAKGLTADHIEPVTTERQAEETQETLPPAEDGATMNCVVSGVGKPVKLPDGRVVHKIETDQGDHWAVVPTDVAECKRLFESQAACSIMWELNEKGARVITSVSELPI